MSQECTIDELLDNVANGLSKEIYGQSLSLRDFKAQNELLISALILVTNESNFDENLKIFLTKLSNEVNIPNKLYQFCAFAIYNYLVELPPVQLNKIKDNYGEHIQKFFLKINSVLEFNIFDPNVLTKALIPLYYNFMLQIQKSNTPNRNLIEFFIEFANEDISINQIMEP